MTEKLFLEDSYAKECEAVVERVEGNGVVLDQTVFYPTGGGQPCDYGTMEGNGKTARVLEVKKNGAEIIHVLENNCFAQGEKVFCRIDWERRYKLMRMHTAMHVLGATFHEKNWLFTGNQVGVEESRVDFSMENFDRRVFEELVASANARLASGAAVKTFELPREEALAIPGAVKLAAALPPDIPVLRMVEIVGIDLQADGGTHVKNTGEVGKIELLKLDNKGSRNKRLYYKLA